MQIQFYKITQQYLFQMKQNQLQSDLPVIFSQPTQLSQCPQNHTHLPLSSSSMDQLRDGCFSDSFSSFQGNRPNIQHEKHHQLRKQRCAKGVVKFNENQEPILGQEKLQQNDQSYLQFTQAGIKHCETCSSVKILHQLTQCRFCIKLFCIQCLPTHQSQGCEKYIHLYLSKYAVCPGCHTMVQKLSGCRHIVCYCRRQFCFQCQDDWTQFHICSIQNKKKIRIRQLRTDLRLKQSNLRSIDQYKKNIRQEQENLQQRKNINRKRKMIQNLEYIRQQPMVMTKVKKYFETKVRDREGSINYWAFARYLPLLIFAQIVLLFLLPLLFILNIVLIWGIIYPLIQLVQFFLNPLQKRSVFEKFSFALWSMLVFPFWVALLAMSEIRQRKTVWLRMAILDSMSLLKGQRPICLTLKRMHIEKDEVWRPICECKLKKCCSICENMEIKILYQKRET